MKKKTGKFSKTTALVLVLMICAGCGRAEEEAEIETAPAAIQTTVTQAPTPTEAPATLTPTPSPVPTQVPLKDLTYVRPSFANVVSGATSHEDERGSFVVTKKTLEVVLPTDSHVGYSWHCEDENQDENEDENGSEIFTVSEGRTEEIPYTYSSRKYGGAEVIKSELEDAQGAFRQRLREEENEEDTSDMPADDIDAGNEDGDVGEEVIIEEIIIYEDDPEYDEYIEEDVEDEVVEEETPEEWQEGSEEGNNQEEGKVISREYLPVSIKSDFKSIHPSFSISGSSKRIKAMAAEGEVSAEEEMTYIYAPSCTGYVFTPQKAGTEIFFLECAKGDGTSSVLDNGFILFAHADEKLDITFDLVWYSFAECVAAPERIPESDASVLIDQVAAQEESAAEAFDSCIRNENTIGAASRVIDNSYWEVYSMDNSVADITSDGGAFYHEDFVDYSWDMFTINPREPGRTTAYFIQKTGDDSSLPTTQIADIHVSDDMSVTVHVRRLDLGVQFD